MAPLSVEVAGLAPFRPLFEYADKTLAFDGPWSHLPRTTVAAEPSDTLRAVLGKASTALGITLTSEAIETRRAWSRNEGLPEPEPWKVEDALVYVLFRHKDDDRVLEGDWDRPHLRRESRQRTATVVLRDAQGRAVWRRPGLDATMAELIDAAEHGLIEGNPLQPYLIPSIPQGDLGGVDQWVALKDALIVLASVAAIAATADGALGLLDRVREVWRRREAGATTSVDKHASSWTDRGAAPSDLLQMLSGRPRSSEEVAALLGCAPAEAEALLWGLGFAYEEDSSSWKYRGDDVAVFIADEIDLAFLIDAQLSDDPDALRSAAQARLANFARSGHLPDPADTEGAVLERAMADLGAKQPGLVRRLLSRIPLLARRMRG